MEYDGTTIRVLLVDAHSLFRDAVAGALAGVVGIEVVAEAGDLTEAMSTAERTKPDVALIEADGLVGDLSSVIERMRASVPGCRVLVLANEEQLGTLAESLQAGASGYLTKDVSVAELVQATRSVNRGQVVVPPRMVGSLLAMLLSHKTHRNEAEERLSRLSNREREVLLLLGDGADKDAIARALVISPETARTHVQNILSKLGVHSRLEAAAFARRNGVARDLVDLGR